MASATKPHSTWAQDFLADIARPVSDSERRRYAATTRRLLALRDGTLTITPDTSSQYIRETREE